MGDAIFDPFAGFGTSLFCSDAIGRIPYCIEIDPARARYIQSKLQNPSDQFCGDARNIGSFDLPQIDFSPTSSPVMNKEDTQELFTAYKQTGCGYSAYLETIQSIYSQLKQIMKPDALMVVAAANLIGNNGQPTLAWEIAAAIGEVVKFERDRDRMGACLWLRIRSQLLPDFSKYTHLAHSFASWTRSDLCVLQGIGILWL